MEENPGDALRNMQDIFFCKFCWISGIAKSGIQLAKRPAELVIFTYRQTFEIHAACLPTFFT